MADIIATVGGGNTVIATVQDSSYLSATTDLSNPAVVQYLTDIGDVDGSTNGLIDGSVLVYKTNTRKWTATTTLDAQNMDGGEF